MKVSKGGRGCCVAVGSHCSFMHSQGWWGWGRGLDNSHSNMVWYIGGCARGLKGDGGHYKISYPSATPSVRTCSPPWSAVMKPSEGRAGEVFPRPPEDRRAEEVFPQHCHQTQKCGERAKTGEEGG